MFVAATESIVQDGRQATRVERTSLSHLRIMSKKISVGK